jgi:hypothetical protein
MLIVIYKLKISLFDIAGERELVCTRTLSHPLEYCSYRENTHTHTRSALHYVKLKNIFTLLVTCCMLDVSCCRFIWHCIYTVEYGRLMYPV